MKIIGFPQKNQYGTARLIGSLEEEKKPREQNINISRLAGR